MKKYIVYGVLGVASLCAIIAIGKVLSHGKKVSFIQDLFQELSDDIAAFKNHPEEFTPGDISLYTQEALRFIHTVADVWDIEIVALGDSDE